MVYKGNHVLEVGAGCLWDEVYLVLDKLRQGVVGGYDAQGVGVAGWLLGGGYSMKTNQYGLGIDHIKAYKIVTGDGRILNATSEINPDLYHALRISLRHSKGLSEG